MLDHRNDGAAAPGQVAPTSDNARRQPGVKGRDNGTTGSVSRRDAFGLSLGVDDELDKRIATARAELALRGVELHELRTGAYLIVLSGCVVHATEVEVVERWIVMHKHAGVVA